MEHEEDVRNGGRLKRPPPLRQPLLGAEMTTTIKRSEFGMGAYVPMLGDDVLLRINVEAIKD